MANGSDKSIFFIFVFLCIFLFISYQYQAYVHVHTHVIDHSHGNVYAYVRAHVHNHAHSQSGYKYRASMAGATEIDGKEEKHVYSVWGLPSEDVSRRLKKVMIGLRSEFKNGPEFEPHFTVVGAITLTEDEAINNFNSSCKGLKAYDAKVDKVEKGTFFYQCVFLLLHPTSQVVETSDHCCRHFGYNSSTPYMPHLSLLYGDLSEEEKKAAQQKVSTLDESIGTLDFKVTRLALYKTDTADKSLKSWKKVSEFNLD